MSDNLVTTAAATPPSRAKPDNIARLQKGILRLAFSFSGQNKQLDQQLDAVKSLVRSHRPAEKKLQQHIDEILNTILSLDSLSEDHQYDDSTHNSITLELLERIKLPAGSEQTLSRIRDRLQDNLQQTELLTLVNEVANLLNRVIADASSTESLSLLREPLLYLLHNLLLPTSLHEKQASLIRELERIRDSGSLQSSLDSFAELMNLFQLKLMSEVDDVGEYLHQLSTQFNLLSSSLGTQHKLQDEASDSTDALQSRFNTRLQSVQNDVETAVSLQSLQATMQVHISDIGELVARYAETEQLRHRQMQQHLDEMNTRITKMEEEAQDLRCNLIDERNRSYKDSLTGSNNRHAYDERITAEYQNWLRTQDPLSLIMIDLDFFKQINDSYGHIAGDKVLCNVSAMMRGQTRSKDFFARIGGEEFIIILPNARGLDAHRIAEKLRQLVSSSSFQYKDKPVPVSISCGVTEFRTGDSINDAYERADINLYRAKEEGRNRVCSDKNIDLEDLNGYVI